MNLLLIWRSLHLQNVFTNMCTGMREKKLQLCIFLRVLFIYEISFRKLHLEWIIFWDKIFILQLGGTFYAISSMDKNKYCLHGYKETEIQTLILLLCQTVTVWQLMKSSLFDICKRMCWQCRFNKGLLLTKANYVSFVELFFLYCDRKTNKILYLNKS